MEPEELIRDYEQALATQDWSQVKLLVHGDACVTFQTGLYTKANIKSKKYLKQTFPLSRKNNNPFRMCIGS